MAEDYAGDLSPEEAWEFLRQDSKAVLVDCRTAAEWAYVGVPDLAQTGRPLLQISWQTFPGMGRNPAFAEEVAASGIAKDAMVLLLCRSGARSRAAAKFLTAQGYLCCYNITSGFEGDLDSDDHRGNATGWKAVGLPWMQQ